MAGLDRDKVYREFGDAVNMDAAGIEAWLDGEESRSVGWTRPGESESVGRQSGRRIVGILRTPKAELDEADYRHMRKAIGFIRRHRAQQPDNLVTSRWRYSLMNWGYDPLRD
jgi:hypothetical protein